MSFRPHWLALCAAAMFAACGPVNEDGDFESEELGTQTESTEQALSTTGTATTVTCPKASDVDELGAWDLTGDGITESVLRKTTGSYTDSDLGAVFVKQGTTCSRYSIPKGGQNGWELLSPPTDNDGIAGAELLVTWKSAVGKDIGQRSIYVIRHKSKAMSTLLVGDYLYAHWRSNLDATKGADLFLVYTTLTTTSPNYGKVKVKNFATDAFTTYSLTGSGLPRHDFAGVGQTNGTGGAEGVIIQAPYVDSAISRYKGGWVKIIDQTAKTMRTYKLPVSNAYTAYGRYYVYTSYMLKNVVGGSALEVIVRYDVQDTSTTPQKHYYLEKVVNDEAGTVSSYTSWKY